MSELAIILAAIKGYSGVVVALVAMGWLTVRAIQYTLTSRGATTQRAGGPAVSAGGDVTIEASREDRIPTIHDMRCPPGVEAALARIAVGVESNMATLRQQSEMIARLIAVEESNGQVLRALADESRVAHDLLTLIQAESRFEQRLGGSGGR